MAEINRIMFNKNNVKYYTTIIDCVLQFALEFTKYIMVMTVN